MLKKTVYLNSMSDALLFTEMTSKLKSNAELMTKDIILDAKSFLSVAGIAMGRKMELCIEDEDEKQVIDGILEFQERHKI